MDLHKLFLFSKMNHVSSPLYISNLLPPHVEDVSSYRLRNAENYVGNYANTRVYAESILSSTLQAWNNLPKAVSSEVPNYMYYHCGDRLEQILHTRLRTECSSLNQHLFRRNLEDILYCTCGEIEINKHFLLACPGYNQKKGEMILSIRQITTGELTTYVLLLITDCCIF